MNAIISSLVITLVPMSTRNWLRRWPRGQVDRLVEHLVVAQVTAVEILVDDHHVVDVRLELERNVLGEQADVDLVIHAAELFDDLLLVFGLVDADERRQVARLEDVEARLVFLVWKWYAWRK